MKYIVLGNIAVLASRSIERVGQSNVDVAVEGVPDGATLCLIKDSGEEFSFNVTSERTSINSSVLTEGNYGVTVIWTTEENEITTRHEAVGNAFAVCKVDNSELSIIPMQISTVTELEHMWSAVVNMLESFIPFMDDVKNGTNVV